MRGSEKSSAHALVMLPSFIKLPALFSRDTDNHTGAIVKGYVLIFIPKPAYMGNLFHPPAVVRISTSFSCLTDSNSAQTQYVATVGFSSGVISRGVALSSGNILGTWAAPNLLHQKLPNRQSVCQI